MSVNGDEITIHQLNSELQRANVRPEQQEMASKQIVSSLVDRQILVQEALKNKLEHNPRVMQAIENAKTQILAQAYLEDKVASIAKPTETEVTDYRAKHPEIFANRKAFIMEEVVFAAEPANLSAVQTLSNSAKTLEDVTQWLNSHQIKFMRTQTAHVAESLTPDLLSKFSKMALNDLIFINTNERIVAGRMLEIKEVPISEKDSKPLIERILTGQKRKALAESEMAHLRGEAKIEYLNKKFAPTSGHPDVPQLSSSEGSANAVTPRQNANAPAVNQKVETPMEKGLSGLK